MLKSHNDLRLIIGFSTSEYCRQLHKSPLLSRYINNKSIKNAIECPSCDTKLRIAVFCLERYIINKGKRIAIYIRGVILSLQFNLMHFIYSCYRICRSYLIIDRLWFLYIFSCNISAIILLLIIGEILFAKFSIFIITDQHLLSFIRYFTFVTDVRASQSIITCNHHTIYFSTLQFSNSSLCLRLELVLKHLESIENKLALSIRAGDRFQLSLRNRLTCNGQNSEAMWGILLEDCVIVWGYWALFHYCDHHLWRAFRINLDSFCDAVLTNYTHSLKVRVKLKATVNKTTMAPLTFESENDLRISVRLIELVIAKVEGFYLHRVSY